jgi:hypothetical protein
MNNHQHSIGKVLIAAVDAPEIISDRFQRIRGHELREIIRMDIVILAAIIFIQGGSHRNRQPVIRGTTRMIEEFISVIVVSGETTMRQKKCYQNEKSNDKFLHLILGYKS